jgi:hypothetical protein
MLPVPAGYREGRSGRKSFHDLLRLADVNGRAGAFNNHILRSKWNYQLTRELSFCVITQYNAVLISRSFTSLGTTKNLNFDFLITYLLHPGTAVYVGCNSNLQNLDPALAFAFPETAAIPTTLRCCAPQSVHQRRPAVLCEGVIPV